MPAPNPQRFGLLPLSQTIEQHPFCGPVLHDSPWPRHCVFAGSSSHVLRVQMFEQHWELVIHGSLCTAQIAPPHVPLLQLTAVDRLFAGRAVTGAHLRALRDAGHPLYRFAARAAAIVGRPGRTRCAGREAGARWQASTATAVTRLWGRYTW